MEKPAGAGLVRSPCFERVETLAQLQDGIKAQLLRQIAVQFRLSPHYSRGAAHERSIMETLASPVGKVARLETRISVDLMEVLRRAAQLQDRTLTDFVIGAAQEAARKIIAEANVVRLSLGDQQRFAAALIDPPKPNAALKRAFARRRKLLL